MEEQWVVKNNTKGILLFPKNKIKFNFFGQEKELCFFTNKTVSELEKDEEVKINLAHNNIITVSKTTREEKKENEIYSQIKELKDLIINSNQKITPQQSMNVDMESIAKAISKEINIKLNIVSGAENVVFLKEEERMREDILKQFVLKNRDNSEKNIKHFGQEKKVDNESEGNEKLLEDIDI